MRLIVINRRYDKNIIWLSETGKVVLPILDLLVSIVFVIHEIENAKVQVGTLSY